MYEWYICDKDYVAKEYEIVIETTSGDKLILMQEQLDVNGYVRSYEPVMTYDLTSQ